MELRTLAPLFLFIFPILSHLSANAAVRESLPQHLHVEVQLTRGSVKARYTLKCDAQKCHLTRDVYGQVDQRDLKTEDATYLIEELKRLPTVSELPAECARSQVEVTVEPSSFMRGKLQSCYLMETKFTPAYDRFLKVLSVAF